MQHKPVRVLLVMTWDVSLALWAEKGLLQREIRLYEELAFKGVDVSILSWGNKEDSFFLQQIDPAIKVISVYNYMPRPSSKILRALLSPFAPFFVRDAFKSADIIKTNQMWGSWVSVIGSVFFRRKLLLRCGYELHDFTVRQGHGRLRCGFIWLMSKLAYGAAHRICVASAEDKVYVAEHFKIDHKKIAVHPNWIDTERFKPIEIEKYPDRILFVGRLTAQKNLKMLLDALEGTNLQLDIIGQGELKADLEAIVKQRNLNVKLLGSVPNDALPEIYNKYKIFVMPSDYEGNPKTLLEAMSCGLAVVGTDVPGIRSVIAHDKSGVLSARDAQSLRDCLVSLMKDQPRIERLGAAARTQISGNQSLAYMVEEELRCYDILMAGRTS
jgi:glycosyltransferase involved in cell wall biosynthesis